MLLPARRKDELPQQGVRLSSSEVEESLRRQIAHDASNTEGHVALAHLLGESGRFQEAAAHYERAIALAPRKATPHHGLVSCRRLTEVERPVIARILALLEERDLTDRQRVTLHFAAGKALDDLADYAGAIRHFDAANELRRRTDPFVRRPFGQFVDRVVARATPEFFAHSQALGQESEMPVLVLGMPRSGTTLVERILSSHPGVQGGGELSFWNDCAPPWVNAPIDALAQAARGLGGDYLDVLRSIGPGAQRVTDKMPFNFYWMGLVHVLLPKARIVHCRRNPIDTCLSIYTTHFTENWGYASHRGDLAFFYRQYLRLMDHWRAVLPPECLLEVDYEEVTAAPETVSRRLTAFCGLDWDPVCLRPESNPDSVQTASGWQARQPIYRSSVERWRHYEPWLGELRELA